MVSLAGVDDERIKKPYLGGWKHRATGVIYHNAASQTGPLAANNVENFCSREVQCINTKDDAFQTGINKATQMWRKDCYISSEKDRYITCGIYETAEEEEIRKNKKAIIIQRCYRSWKLLKNIKFCAMAYRKLRDDCTKHEEEKIKLHEERNRLGVIRQVYPQKRADFDKILALIETWRQWNQQRIRRNFFRGGMTAENLRMLEKIREMLKDVDKHRRSIRDERTSKQLTEFLTFHSEPVRWTGYKGKLIEMVTLRVQRARELKNLYDLLVNESYCSIEKRIEMFIHLKYALSLHNCYPALDLADLIEQKILLLSRGLGSSLVNLDKRISIGFLYFARNSHDCCSKSEPEEELSERTDKDKLLCRSCMKLMGRKKFNADAGVKKLSKCISCTWLYHQNVKKIDYDPYSCLLNDIRADEFGKKCFSSLLYVIQEPEMYHLVKNIWHGRSIVSEVDDIYRLRLVRFHVNQEWAPWNCILLTEEESKAHYYITDLSSVYSKQLLYKIYLIHETARSHFQDLIKLEKKFRASLG
ncbi:IQ and ubiquitin-like domain-containing protein [Microplitis mediator]|uniref:IQ and ubiquitin-like domain-containing protein n=1 Tax=Microplitis mediator TaxID=375433 RepID=UPI00255620F9|nr:IQ and ubiquitin-like domain-containing protein [Microplitis mediator]